MTETICATVPRELARRTGPAQALIPMPEYRCNVTLRDGPADGLRVDGIPFIKESQDAGFLDSESHRFRDICQAVLIKRESSFYSCATAK